VTKGNKKKKGGKKQEKRGGGGTVVKQAGGEKKHLECNWVNNSQVRGVERMVQTEKGTGGLETNHSQVQWKGDNNRNQNSGKRGKGGFPGGGKEIRKESKTICSI